MHTKICEKLSSFELLTYGFVKDNIYKDIDFYMRVGAYEKHVSGKQL